MVEKNGNMNNKWTIKKIHIKWKGCEWNERVIKHLEKCGCTTN